MKAIRHFFKRKWQKIYIKYKRIADEKYVVYSTPHAHSAYTICKLLIDREDSVLLTSPISGKRFIKQEDGGIFIVIENNEVRIVNHVYQYNIGLHGKNYTRIIEYFDNSVEKRRAVMEEQIMSNVKHSLAKIVESLKLDIK